MKAMRDFFKDEASFIEYTLLYMSGEQRTSILGITAKHYSDKELAENWALAIISKISDEDAINEVLRIYRRMIGDPNAELPVIQEEAKAEEPKAEEPKKVITYVDSNNETSEVDADAWVIKYLAKKGKNMDTLEKAIMRMTKAQILERFPNTQWGLIEDHSKTEMLSIIFTALWDMGYKEAA